MGTEWDALKLAASQLGVTETPNGSNITPYTKWYGVTGAWCDMFMSWVLYHSGTPQGTGKGFAWVSNHRDWLARQGRVFKVDKVRPGDLLFFEWGTTPGGYDHIGMCESVEGDTLVTIEGNVQNKVLRLRRPRWSGIPEIGRPAYATTPPPTPTPTPKPPAPQEDLDVSRNAIVTNLDGRGEEFLIDNKGRLLQRWQGAPNGGWDQWVEFRLEDGRSAEGALSEIAAYRNQDGRLEIVVRNRQFAYAARAWQKVPGGKWTGWYRTS